MTYEEILKSNLLHLPISPKENYLKSITKILNEFRKMVNQLNDENLNIVGLPIHSAYVKNAQNAFIDGLLRTIKLYYEGKPAKAYESLRKTMDSELKDYREILKIRKYEKSESFFRIRLTTENFPLSSKQMFHIPFELRGRVATQRYSIPGFPCLYLGRTIYGCWEEMNRPNLNDFQIVRLESLKPINYLDLTRPKYPENLRERDIYHYFMTWPLIACCSVRVQDYSHTFKSEYIIPQLLLQWIRETENIDGIRYNSTHINFHDSQSEGDFSNLVLPVKENHDKGYCNKLLGMFNMTESISWQLKQHATGGGFFLGTEEDEKIVNMRIPKLELIAGRPYEYALSALGSLEIYLDGMDTKRIEI